MKQFHVNESLLESSGIFEKNIAKISIHVLI